MSSPALETFLARLYTDEALRLAFLDDPHGEAQRHGLPAHDVAALLAIDRIGLQMAAASFTAKRAGRAQRPPAPSLWRRLLRG
ncbi:hypothetical protein [Janthinobacterium fluminis]|uniref:Extradiol ring-cleavage dioxygenase LigAB LigA subunit domain-containing protein n=1 Tax=Janthinobacterium fluminis TaxID=2987524 RepID=A0ABT5K8H8_9BURK|nr:hypothetical protein [Janthinobacterium fluminis]MDC8760376.1 hypothetical protein [Janthinobacterium fluminis]